MPRVPSLSPRKVVRIREDEGFEKDHQTGSHLVMRHPDTKRRAVVPVHARDIPRGTLLRILKEAGIDPTTLA
ncbi:MAG: type II toxin-antitoxin system HicA family toxin [Phycisphaerae bacterium]|nr:type II toxin-antitoxin system HicA family toxin [Phycisphaerae bacterium]